MTAIRADQVKAIHVLKSQAGLSEADYRTHLKERFKVVSSKALTEGQAGALMDDLRALGGKSRPASRRASGRFAPVLQALWIAGYNLGVVENSDDSALLAFVKRQCKVDHDRFLTDGEEAAKAIEALKGWLAREACVVWGSKALAQRQGRTLANLNKQAVVHAIARRLRAKGLPGFDLENFACLERFPKVEACVDSELDRLAAKMGAMLRERMGRQG